MRSARRVAAFAAAALSLSALGACSGGRPVSDRTPHPAPATTVPSAAATPSPGPGGLLALGDSVPFGFSAAGDPHRPQTYVGYPELVGRALRLPVTNAACPGVTTAGFLDATVRDGCRMWRALAPLHVRYSGSQLDFAVGFLRAHPDTRLVTLTLGANDLLSCQDRSGCRSLAQLRPVVDRAVANLTAAVDRIRAVFPGRLLLVTYYVPDYTDAFQVVAVSQLDAHSAAVVRAAGGTVVDGFTAFRAATASYGGSACRAGLLAAGSLGGCDVHPSRAGAQLLADAVVRAAR